MERKIALITGVNGQTGSYLAELLLNKGYIVYGMVRRNSVDNLERLRPPHSGVLKNDNFALVYGDVTDLSSILHLLEKYHPDEFYGLAAASHVGMSFDAPVNAVETNGVGCLNCLEAIRLYQSNHDKMIKFYQSSTSELMGSNYIEKEAPDFVSQTGVGKYQDENTPLTANSPYGLGKLLAHRAVGLYREAYGLFACAGLVYNHSSSRRGNNFLTRKVTIWLGKFYNWCMRLTDKSPDSFDFQFDDGHVLLYGHKFPKLELGNLDAIRDWSHAKDMAYAMWLMLQNDKPVDYVVSSGRGVSVRDFVKIAFNCIGIDNYEDFIRINPKFFRPREVEFLQGDSSKIRNELGWKPTVEFSELVTEMVTSDIERSK